MTNLDMISVDYRKIGPTTLDVWRRDFELVDSPFLPYVEEMWSTAGMHSALCLGMSWLENKHGSTGIIIQPEDFNPLSSRPWIDDPRATDWKDVIDWETRKPITRDVWEKDKEGNPTRQVVFAGKMKVPPYCAGVIIDSTESFMLRFNTPTDAIREWRRRIIDDRQYKGGVYNDKFSLTDMLNTYAPPGDVHPETGLDNKNIEYPQVVATKLNHFYEMEQETEQETGVAGFKAHDWSHIGFPKGPVYLPDDITVDIKIIPSSVAGWTSGQKLTGQSKTTWHDTGNSQSSRNGEYNWARGGGRAGINSPGSYNGIFDKDGIIITQRFDELVGHAGNANGNRQSWAFEQAYGTGFDGGLRVGAALHGGICAAMGWEVDTHLVQHNYWSGKNCPGQIRRRGMWSQVVKMTSEAARLARIAANGEDPTNPVPVYDTPVPIPELEAFKGKADYEIPYRVNGDGWVGIYVGDRVKAIRQTPRSRYSDGTGATGPDINPGEEFNVDFLLISTDFPDHYYSPYMTRILAEDTERVSDVKAG